MYHSFPARINTSCFIITCGLNVLLCYLNPICNNWITITCLNKICSKHFKYHKKITQYFLFYDCTGKIIISCSYTSISMYVTWCYLMETRYKKITNKSTKLWNFGMIDSKRCIACTKIFEVTFTWNTASSQLYRSSLKILRFIRSICDNLC